jgi:hypothetical protein
MAVTAWVIYTDPAEADEKWIETSTGHKIQFGGNGGAGYCYTHLSYDCPNNLTPAERCAVDGAVRSIP